MTKGARITLTKSQAESESGKALIDRILSMCHDGELTIREVDEFHIFLRGDRSNIPAFAFLRAITRECVADGVIDGPEELRLKRAFERVVPKEVRGVISTHLESVGLPAWDEWTAEPAWTRHEASDKQIEYIVALGGHVGPGLSKGEASKIIDELLTRRPPTPRQVMLLRFFDRLDLNTATKEEVSEWIDNVFCLKPNYEAAWERFKRVTHHDPFCQDPAVVPIGAYRRYLNRRRTVGFLFRLFSRLFSRRAGRRR